MEAKEIQLKTDFEGLCLHFHLCMAETLAPEGTVLGLTLATSNLSSLGARVWLWPALFELVLIDRGKKQQRRTLFDEFVEAKIRSQGTMHLTYLLPALRRDPNSKSCHGCRSRAGCSARCRGNVGQGES